MPAVIAQPPFAAGYTVSNVTLWVGGDAGDTMPDQKSFSFDAKPTGVAKLAGYGAGRLAS